jgi:hypothetical protein
MNYCGARVHYWQCVTAFLSLYCWRSWLRRLCASCRGEFGDLNPYKPPLVWQHNAGGARSLLIWKNSEETLDAVTGPCVENGRLIGNEVGLQGIIGREAHISCYSSRCHFFSYGAPDQCVGAHWFDDRIFKW